MFIVYTKYFEIDIIFLLDKKFARHEQWFNIGFCEHMKYLLANGEIKNSKKWHQSVNTMCFWEANNNIRAQKHNDNVIMLTERADKTENRDPNVFNFVYLFIILGKWNEDG